MCTSSFKEARRRSRSRGRVRQKRPGIETGETGVETGETTEAEVGAEAGAGTGAEEAIETAETAEIWFRETKTQPDARHKCIACARRIRSALPRGAIMNGGYTAG